MEPDVILHQSLPSSSSRVTSTRFPSSVNRACLPSYLGLLAPCPWCTGKGRPDRATQSERARLQTDLTATSPSTKPGLAALVPELEEDADLQEVRVRVQCVQSKGGSTKQE